MKHCILSTNIDARETSAFIPEVQDSIVKL